MSEHEIGGAAPQAAPGWYPTGDGNQRYWNGTVWTDHIAPGQTGVAAMSSDDNTMGMLVHLLALFTGFIGPLVLWLIKKDSSAYVDYHGKEALNFQITMFIGFIISLPLMLVIVGFFLFFALIIANIVLPILAAIAANRGEYYTYPWAWRVIT